MTRRQVAKLPLGDAAADGDNGSLASSWPEDLGGRDVGVIDLLDVGAADTAGGGL